MEFVLFIVFTQQDANFKNTWTVLDQFPLHEKELDSLHAVNGGRFIGTMFFCIKLTPSGIWKKIWRFMLKNLLKKKCYMYCQNSAQHVV
jgi:hypothetical protein